MRWSLLIVLGLLGCADDSLKISPNDGCRPDLFTRALSLSPERVVAGDETLLTIGWEVAEALDAASARLLLGASDEIEVSVSLDLVSATVATAQLLNPFGAMTPIGTGALVVSGSGGICGTVEAATSFVVE